MQKSEQVDLRKKQKQDWRNKMVENWKKGNSTDKIPSAPGAPW